MATVPPSASGVNDWSPAPTSTHAGPSGSPADVHPPAAAVAASAQTRPPVRDPVTCSIATHRALPVLMAIKCGGQAPCSGDLVSGVRGATYALVPARIRRPLELLRTLWTTGALAEPRALAAQLRHRALLGRIHKALFYHRYTTALLLGHEVGLFEALRGGPMTAAQLATTCALGPGAAEQLLRILEAEGMLARRDGRFQLSGFAELYLLRGGPQSAAPMLDLMAAQAAAFPEVRAGLRDGGVPRELDIFSTTGRHRAFLDAVNGYLDRAGADLLHRVDLPEVRSFITGSMGVSFSARVLDRFPAARVTYGCLPHLMREVPRLRATYRVPAARVDGSHEHGGDPRADRWGDEAFDLVFLTKKMILDPGSRLGEGFAAKAFQVLRPGGAAIFWESIHTDAAPTPLPRAMEAVMDLIASPGGSVNTERGIAAMLGGIGYRGVQVVPCLGGQTTFVVARR